MPDARCQLVREIEEAAEADSMYFGDATTLTRSPHWPRIRAALEAAEELIDGPDHIYVGHCPTIAPNRFDPKCPACQALKRYRAATRKP